MSIEKDHLKQRLADSAESLLGHSHPKEEFFTVEEFSAALGAQPVVCIQKPMNLANENPEETILRANVALFKI